MPEDAAATRAPGADPSPTDGGQPVVTDPAAAPAADGSGATAAPPEGGQPVETPGVPVVGSPTAQEEGAEPEAGEHDWQKRHADSQKEALRLKGTLDRLRDKGLVDDEGNPVEPAPAEPAQPAQPQRQWPVDPAGELYSTYHPDNVGMNAHLEYYRAQFGELATDEYKRKIRDQQYGSPAQPAPQPGVSAEQVEALVNQGVERGIALAESRGRTFDTQVEQIGNELGADFLAQTIKTANGPEMTREAWLEGLYRSHGIPPQQALIEYDRASVNARIREQERANALEDIQRESVAAGGPAVRPAMPRVEPSAAEAERLAALGIPSGTPQWTGPGKDQLTH